MLGACSLCFVLMVTAWLALLCMQINKKYKVLEIDIDHIYKNMCVALPLPLPLPLCCVVG